MSVIVETFIYLPINHDDEWMQDQLEAVTADVVSVTKTTKTYGHFYQCSYTFLLLSAAAAKSSVADELINISLQQEMKILGIS